ncbi:F0F1 ATP synthase subunit gamma [Candidatus Dependentiae bacterium]|nr:F0F1 ATP synthase subunit gamma [Candidatus Dependentiae bacterium]
MAQLIQMRQRIKAVETTKKITQAMRLISMSTHSRLRHKKVHLLAYKNAFQNLWQKIKHLPATNTTQDSALPQRHLVILVSSQKGLCGTFNTHLFKFFDIQLTQFTDSYDFISVGRYATDHLKSLVLPLVASYSTFSSNNFVAIANAITEIISKNSAYSSVTVYSNYPRTFFVQKPQKAEILPLDEKTLVSQSAQEPSQDYLIEESAEQLNTLIERLTLSISLQELLFESLLSEQAARFLSMDSATRNAEKLIVAMKLEYNKTRQATITRELTELSASY